MAGGSTMGGDSNDNPVPLNVTAMVDIIFCLCIFFMCSFKVKAVEGRMDSWLPKNTGMLTNTPPNPDAEPLRIILIRDVGELKTRRYIEKRPIESIEQLQSLVRDAKADRRGDKLSVAIDAGTRVPWRDVVDVVNVCRNEKADSIEFVFGAVELDKELGGAGP